MKNKFKKTKRRKEKKTVFLMPNGLVLALSAKRIAKICRGAWKIYNKIIDSI